MNASHREYLPALQACQTLYTTVHIDKLEEIHRAIALGEDPDEIFRDTSSKWILRAYEESRHTEILANGWLSLNDRDILTVPFDDLDDHSLATLSWIMFERCPSDDTLRDRMSRQSDASLLKCLFSSNGSILVDYDCIFSDVLGYALLENEQEHLRVSELYLAHNLKHRGGKNALTILRNLASDLMLFGHFHRGIDIYKSLQRFDPSDSDLYEEMALTFSKVDISNKHSEPYWFDEMRSLLETKTPRDGNMTIDDLARSAIPHIEEIQVKNIPLSEPHIDDPFSDVPTKSAYSLEIGFSELSKAASTKKNLAARVRNRTFLASKNKKNKKKRKKNTKKKSDSF